MKTLYILPIIALFGLLTSVPQAHAADLKQLAEELVNLTVKEVTENVPTNPTDICTSNSKCIAQLRGIEKTDIRRGMVIAEYIQKIQKEHLVKQFNTAVQRIREGGMTVGAGQIPEILK